MHSGGKGERVKESAPFTRVASPLKNGIRPGHPAAVREPSTNNYQK